MVVVQFVYAGVNIFFKLVANDGMSLSVLIAYRFIFATAFIVPVALFFERKSLSEVNGKLLFQAFLCGLFGGSLQQNLYVEALALVSATYATTMLNLIPAVTFIMAVSLGLEKANLGTLAGKAKVIGTFTGIGGAMILTFYKGTRIYLWSTHFDLVHHMASSHGATASRLLGCMLALGTCTSYSLWLIIQGILASGVVCTVIAWCVRKRGPLFVSVFNPLMLVLVTLAGFLILDETLNVGSIVGAVFIVFGLYTALWGNSKEARKAESEKLQSKGSVQCESIQIVNLYYAGNQTDNDKKDQFISSVAPNNPSINNHS